MRRVVGLLAAVLLAGYPELAGAWPGPGARVQPAIGHPTTPAPAPAVLLLREQRQRERALVGVAWLLSLGLAAAAIGYWRLRRSQRLLAQAHQEISQAIAEKEVLVQESHHRVKNNLQLVSSLLGWQSSIISDPTLQQALSASQARIQSMALVHEFLYQADNLSRVCMAAYLRQLLESLRAAHHSAERVVRLSMKLAPLALDAREATTLGLLANELVTNAYKHAFRGLRQGHLQVSLLTEGEGFELRVEDDGTGLAAGGAGEKTLGLQLVETLARQLKATVTTTASRPSGTLIVISRP